MTWTRRHAAYLFAAGIGILLLTLWGAPLSAQHMTGTTQAREQADALEAWINNSRPSKDLGRETDSLRQRVPSTLTPQALQVALEQAAAASSGADSSVSVGDTTNVTVDTAWGPLSVQRTPVTIAFPGTIASGWKVASTLTDSSGLRISGVTADSGNVTIDSFMLTYPDENLTAEVGESTT